MPRQRYRSEQEIKEGLVDNARGALVMGTLAGILMAAGGGMLWEGIMLRPREEGAATVASMGINLAFGGLIMIASVCYAQETISQRLSPSLSDPAFALERGVSTHALQMQTLGIVSGTLIGLGLRSQLMYLWGSSSELLPSGAIVLGLVMLGVSCWANTRLAERRARQLGQSLFPPSGQEEDAQGSNDANNDDPVHVLEISPPR